MSDSQSAQSIIVSKLIEAIEKGKIPSSGKLPSLTKLAKKHTVSRSTVKRALQILKDRGYIDTVPGKGTFAHDPHTIQRKQIRDNCVSFIFPLMESPHTLRMSLGIEQFLSENGYFVATFNSQNNVKHERENLLKAMEIGSKGIILMPASPSPRAVYSNVETYLKIKQSGIPLVFADNYPQHFDIDCVTIDYFKAFYALTRHLITRGHTKIALINGPSYVNSFYDCYQGFSKALIDSKLKINPHFVFPNPSVPYELYGKEPSVDFQYLPKYIKNMLTDRERPTAIILIVYDDNHLAVLRESGLQIPRDLSVCLMICEGNELPLFKLFKKEVRDITHVVQPNYELGTTAAEIVLEEIKNPSKEYIKKELEMTFHEGNSVARIKSPVKKSSKCW